MRSEQEMLDLILETAKNDDRIRAVMMNGSRANPDAPRDIFQDFDIVYFVTDVAPFKHNLAWIERFGELMILQMPEAMDDPPPQNDGKFVYLMQFADGNRIDLSLFPIARLPELENDSLSVLLLDKDTLFAPFPPPDNSDYLPSAPTAKAFADCCNEFWWIAANVAKGLWREEILYAKEMMDRFMREQLMNMLVWHIGIKTRFSANPGKFGKYFRHNLDPERWTMLEQTYSDASYANTWDALFVMCDLFRITTVEVAAHFGFDYPHGDDERVSAHLRHVRLLPKDATEIY